MIRFARLAVFALLGGMLVAAPTAPTAASTDERRQISMELVFLWKNLPISRMHIEASINDRRYTVKTRSRALGVAWAFTRWKSVTSAEGTIAGKMVRPLRYLSDSKFRSRESLIRLTYPAPGKTVTQITPLKSSEDWTTVPEAMRQGAPDPLTAIVANLRPGNTNPCNWAGEIYDGRRRYHLGFRQEGEDTLKSSMWNRYAGPAIRCRMIRKTLAGWHKKERAKKGKKRPAPTIWFARIGTAGMWLPVKLMAITRWGQVRGEIFRYKVAATK